MFILKAFVVILKAYFLYFLYLRIKIEDLFDLPRLSEGTVGGQNTATAQTSMKGRAPKSVER
jgi:hypothetical protein